MAVTPNRSRSDNRIGAAQARLRERWRAELEAFFLAFGGKFQRDRTTTLAASFAFYTILSLAPLSVVVLFAFSRLDQSLVDRFVREASGLVGVSGGAAVLAAVESAKARPITGGLASLASFLVVLVSAGAMFSEIRDSLAIVFEHRAPEKITATFFQKSWALVRTRLLSAGFALSFVLVMAISLVLSAFLTAVADRLGLVSADLLISFALYAAIFGLLFTYGTRPGLPWRSALRGGVVTSVLFLAGKILIGFYIGNSSVANAYGAAGSAVALLVWVYWASLIIFSGAQAAWLLAGRRYRTYDQPQARVLTLPGSRR